MVYILWSKSDLCIKDACKVRTKTIETLLRVYFVHLNICNWVFIVFIENEEKNLILVELRDFLSAWNIRKLANAEKNVHILFAAVFSSCSLGGEKKFIVTICAILFVRCTYFRCEMKKKTTNDDISRLYENVRVLLHWSPLSLTSFLCVDLFVLIFFIFTFCSVVSMAICASCCATGCSPGHGHGTMLASVCV